MQAWNKGMQNKNQRNAYFRSSAIFDKSILYRIITSLYIGITTAYTRTAILYVEMTKQTADSKNSNQK